MFFSELLRISDMPGLPAAHAKLAGSAVASLAVAATLVAIAPSASAVTPVVPDTVPNLVDPLSNFQPKPPRNTYQPHIEVTFADGRPVAGRQVHRGDELIIRGTGFDPAANRGGFPLPVPPGVPNGVYALYGAFPQHWRPSEGAPASTRAHPHDNIAWVTPPGTLAAIPHHGIDMRRSIARQATPMDAAGNFRARIIVDPPAETPGDNWGVYVYPAAGSVNAPEEIFIPIDFSEEPGPNTPPPARPDLEISVSRLEHFFEALGGGARTKAGALGPQDGKVFFTRMEDSEQGLPRYRGEVHLTARFSLMHIVVRQLHFERRGDIELITAEVSRRPDVGPDELIRVPIAVVTGQESHDGDARVLHTNLGDIIQHR